MQNDTQGGPVDRLRAMFPDREFFMRSGGQVRFIKVSSRTQIAVAALAAVLLAAWVITMVMLALSQFGAARDRQAMLDREAKMAGAESRMADYRQDVRSVARDLERRQDFIEKMSESLPADVRSPEAADTAPADTAQADAAQAGKTISAALPEATGLARIEARQLAFVERLTRFADRRSAAASDHIRALGLDPRTISVAAQDRSAQGGPLLRLATSSDGRVDPRFRRLGLSLARMAALERGLAAIPQVLPASLDFISSGFGFREDPFTGADAFHAGLDFRGPVGAPIHAAASGRVAFAGVRPGYGNCVEIDHGNGLMTRYAHMSAFRARVGQAIAPGDVIGAIGSTGRSTGPHLHFEVRLNDRPINPRPFLEAKPDVPQDLPPPARRHRASGRR